MGPGGPALLSGIIEGLILPETLIKSIRTLGGDFLPTKLETNNRIALPIKTELMAKFKLRDNAIRRIAHRLDFEGKRRPIGILDY